MRNRRIPQIHGTPTKCLANVSTLESRVLLSRQVAFPDGSSQVFPLSSRLPRTGGVPIQSGTALTIGVGQPKSNAVQLTLDGAGGAQAEWNGGPVHSFTGVQDTLVQIGRARFNQVTFNLNGPRTGGTSFATGLLATTPEVSTETLAHTVHADRLRFRTSGTAVQSGTVLTVTVNAPKSNTVEISSLNSGQVVQAEWNGGAVHNFSGVSTIIVDTTTGQSDLVALDITAAKGP
jgi:hypothetical protein